MRPDILLSAALAIAACSQAQQPKVTEQALRTTDERHRRADVAGDVAAMAEITHTRLTLNAPNNRIVGREQFLALMQSGRLGTRSLERVPEAVIVAGDVGIVMGHETAVPAPTSISGRMYGTSPQNRRFTNIYVREESGWKLIGRHANVVPDKR